MTRRIKNPIDPEFEGVFEFGCSDAVDESLSAAGNGTAEVTDAGVVGEVLAPGTALDYGFLLKEEFRGGGEVV